MIDKGERFTVASDEYIGVGPDPLDDPAHEARRLEMRGALLGLLGAIGSVTLAAIPATVEVIVLMIKSRYFYVGLWVIFSLIAVAFDGWWVYSTPYPILARAFERFVVCLVLSYLISWARESPKKRG